MSGHLKLGPAQADALCKLLVCDLGSAMEDCAEPASIADALAFEATAKPLLALIHELSETRETTEAKRVHDLARGRLDHALVSIGHQTLHLAKAKEGDPEYVGPEGQAAAVALSEETIAALANEAWLLREIFEQTRDLGLVP